MIVEREQMMTRKELENKEWFPKYIIFGKDPQEGKDDDMLASIASQLNELKLEHASSIKEILKN